MRRTDLVERYSVAVTMEDTRKCKIYTREVFTNENWERIYALLNDMLDEIKEVSGHAG